MTNLEISNKLIVILLGITIAFTVATTIIVFQLPPAEEVFRVDTGSMCVTYDGACPGRLNATEPTLHVGDFVVIETVDPEDLSADYPDSDIIVFHKPGDIDELVVRRIVDKEKRDGVFYFTTEGDGNGYYAWPGPPDQNDPWSPFSQDLIVGKVVNTNYPYTLMSTSFWVSLVTSIAAGIAALILFVFRIVRTR